MKSRLTALLLTLALLLTALPVCTAEEEASATRMPFYDVFPLQLDDNTVLELPVDWGYQFVELEGVPPIAYAMNDSEQLLMMVKIPADYTPNEASDRLGLTSFIPEGTAVMLGITTPQSTRLQEMTINDMPAVLVEMNGQGFDILWIGDSGDLYFLMFPNDDDAFVQQALEVGQSLRVFHRKDERVNPASDFAYTTENGEVTITDYTGTREHVLIPSEIGGFPVTMLADKAFYEKHVTTVVVPDSVTEIGDLCFSGDNYLVSLTLPDGLGGTVVWRAGKLLFADGFRAAQGAENHRRGRASGDFLPDAPDHPRRRDRHRADELPDDARAGGSLRGGRQYVLHLRRGKRAADDR